MFLVCVVDACADTVAAGAASCPRSSGRGGRLCGCGGRGGGDGAPLDGGGGGGGDDAEAESKK